MVISKRSRVGAALVLATTIVMGGVVGCGDAGSSRGAGAVTDKADAVVVTYYYLPG